MTASTRCLSEPANVMGYFCGTAAALLVVGLATAAHPQDGLGTALFIGPPWLVLAATALLVPLAPVLLIGKLAGRDGLATSTGAIAWGVGVGMITLPLIFVLSRSLTPAEDGFALGLVKAFRFTWPLYAGAGATGGLTWWIVSYSQPLTPVRTLLRGAATGTGAPPIRRAASTLLGVMLLLGAGWTATRMTAGDPAAETRAPGFALLAEVPVNGRPSRLAWSPDGQSWAALSSLDPWLAICGANGENLREFTLAHTGAAATPVFTRGGRQLVLAGTLDAQDGYALSAINAQTGEMVFAVRDPVPAAGGVPGMAVSLAMSSDGGTLAIAFNGSRPGQPVSLFSTADWTRRAAFDAGPGPGAGVGPIALSADARLVLVSTGRALVLIDTASGQIRRTLDLEPRLFSTALSISPDGTMAAVAGDSTVQVIRLADGVTLAVYPAQGRIGRDVVWDPRQRYIAFADTTDTLHFWSPFHTGGHETRFQLRSPMGGIAFSPDGDRVAAGNGAAVSFFKISGP